MYQFEVASPEIDVLILDQMEDQDLVHYCQTNSYASQLCSIPRLQNRINTFKYYKTFDLSSLFNDIEIYCPYPIMIHRYAQFNDDILSIINNDIHILYLNKYIKIKCLTQDGEENFIQIEVTEQPNNIKLNTIINSYENNEGSVWDLDLKSIYNAYVYIGLKKYAKIKTLEVLNEHKNYQNDYQSSFYKLFILRLWFLSHVILYKLEDDSIDNLDLDIDEDFVVSPLFNYYINKLNEDINDFYNLLYQYINKLD